MSRHSDIAMNWNDRRDRRWKTRQSYHDCPNCVFGGNARKIAPGSDCSYCGWKTPELEAKERMAQK